MTLKAPIMTPEQFDVWVLRPENADKSYEFIAGEIVEKMVANNESSYIGYNIGAAIHAYAKQHDLGRVSGEQAGYMVNGERYIPDVGYISKLRQPIRNKDAYNPLAPDLVVEVISPTDRPKTLSRKIANYLAAGTVVWVVSPDDQQVDVYVPGQSVRVLGIDDVLDGGTVLPGFILSMNAVFAD